MCHFVSPAIIFCWGSLWAETISIKQAFGNVWVNKSPVDRRIMRTVSVMFLSFYFLPKQKLKTREDKWGWVQHRMRSVKELSHTAPKAESETAGQFSSRAKSCNCNSITVKGKLQGCSTWGLIYTCSRIGCEWKCLISSFAGERLHFVNAALH